MAARARIEARRNPAGGPRIAGGRTRWSTPPRGIDDVAHLRMLRENRDYVDARIRVTVQRLRVAGASWTVIGDALGITRSAAQKRFGSEALL